MSAKAATSDQVISLPKGGGAQRGIGETFSPDLFTGTGNFTVPIALPAGRNGFQPQLNLGYSTGNGNGLFGLGWSLDVPGVSRKTSKGLPGYDDRHDTFILSGAEDLVPVPGGPDGTTPYRPRTEGLFARILHLATGDWKVRSKDGLVSRYGTPRPAGDNPAWRDPAAVTDPDDPRRIFAWKLSQTVDPFGNRIEYEYERDAVQTQGPHRWDQLRLAQIRYADYGDPDNPDFLIAVSFVYEDRLDPFSDYRAGFEIRTLQRCSRIEVATRPDANTSLPSRTYHLQYLPSEPTSNNISLLSRIRVEGQDGDVVEELPPLEFAYTTFEPQQRHYEGFGNDDSVPERSLAAPGYELVDLFGNGLPSVFHLSENARYWRNLGEGRLDGPRSMQGAPSGLRLEDAGVQLADMDGDGRADLLVTDGLRGGYFPLTFTGEWDRGSFVRYGQAPTVNLEDPNVRLLDLDGDGVVDALRTASSFELYFNRGRSGWDKIELRSRAAPEEFPDVSFSDSRVKLADLSGDGLQDIALIHNGRVDYWPYLGHGRWGRRITMRNSPRFEDAAIYGVTGYDPRRVLLGDVDGDGCADLIYVGSGHITVWINQSGNGWSEPITVRGTPSMSDVDAVRLADMHGTGTSGVLWTYDFGTQREGTYKFLDLTGGIKPYLLNGMNNNMGATTRVEYAPSTRFYLEDQKRPETRWKTTLPFPVQVVARVEVEEAFSQSTLTTRYAYHHGYWDGTEREFRGFGRVDRRDSELFGSDGAQSFSPPTETRTWFHLGPVGGESNWDELDLGDEYWPDDPQQLSRSQDVTTLFDALSRRDQRDAVRAWRGSILRTELYALDGTHRQTRPYTVTESQPGLREEAVPGEGESNRSRIFFPHTLSQRTTQWERGDDPMTQFVFTSEHDDSGQPHRETQIACPRGWRQLADAPAEPYLATRRRTVYASPVDTGVYIMDRVASVTTCEITNTSNKTVLAVSALADGHETMKIAGQTVNFYDGAAFEGRGFGQVGKYGALVRTESLVIDDQINAQVYDNDIPPYLKRDYPANWWENSDYPREFAEPLPGRAGYAYHSGPDNSPFVEGYFAVTERRRYDFHENAGGKVRGLVTVQLDPMGNDATISYDAPYALLPQQVTDAVGLATRADYDYRVLQPKVVTDINGNQTHFVFNPMGLLKETRVSGKPDRQNAQAEGDRQRPSVVMEYDFLAFMREEQPISVVTIRQVHHDTEADVPQPQLDATIKTVEYSDGAGRLLQSRLQAEDVLFGTMAFGHGVLPASQNEAGGDSVGQPVGDPTNSRVVVSGWQIFDNKGRVVEKYEPFFAEGWKYAPPSNAELGQKATMFYDPRGQVTRTRNPDGSEQRMVYGVPGSRNAPDMSGPDIFEPTPWETYTFDANDNAGRTHAQTSAAYQSHWNTPSSVLVDALGRTVKSVARNGTDAQTQWFTTSSAYDIRGNLLEVTDAKGRSVFKYVYDFANRPLRVDGLDAGSKRSVLDAAGNVVEQRDGKGALTLHAYDTLQRPVRLWARDGANQEVTLRERLEYGDGGSRTQPAGERDANKAANQLGKVAKHYDEAGLLLFAAYDFKGNLQEKVRRVIGDAAILKVFERPPANWQITAFRANWKTLTDADLEAAEYKTTLSYDALNRVKKMEYPQDVDAARKVLIPRYNRAGALESVQLDGATYVQRIAYNAKGQRTLVAYGNNVMTRYAYDGKTFRLLRMRTESYAAVNNAPDQYHPTAPAAPLQDLAYEYDLVGNLLALHDRVAGSGVPVQPDQLDRTFAYDALYRLLSATGRECDTPTPAPPWDDAVRCSDVTRTRRYVQSYSYDEVGNMTQLRHEATTEAGQNDAFNRGFVLAQGSNRLATVTSAGADSAYRYDENGNLVKENATRYFEWDHSDRLRVFRNQPDNAEPTVHTHYFYDATGQRVMKFVRKQGQREITVYIDGIFEHHRIVRNGQNGQTEQNNTLHIMDDQKRIALVRVGAALGDATPAVKYHLGDHLGSSHVVLDEAGALVNREEFTPYGETSFGSFARKRYRFTGKERDEESGFYYHGARYYAPWLARWTSCDPAGMIDGVNVYEYVRGNPMNLADSSGMQSDNITSNPSTTAIQTFDESGQTAADRNHINPLEEQARSRYLEQSPQERMKADQVTRPLRQAAARAEVYSSMSWQERTLYEMSEHTGGNDIARALTGKTQWAESLSTGERFKAGIGGAMTAATWAMTATAIGKGIMAGQATLGRSSREALSIMAEVRRVGNAGEEMARYSLREAGFTSSSGSKYTLKDAGGKTTYAGSGRKGSRLIDVPLEAENGAVSGLEIKTPLRGSPLDPLEAARTSKQLRNEATIIEKGATFYGPKTQLRPYVGGEGTGISTGWWQWNVPKGWRQ